VKYLRLHALGGVGIKVTRCEHVEISVGTNRLKNVTLALQPSPADQIKDLRDKILTQDNP
jgi:small subunit ribosomal protein S10